MEGGFEVFFPQIADSNGYIIQPQKKRDQLFAYHITAIIKPPEIAGVNMIDGFAAKNNLRYNCYQ
jgi:hypothetical protein